MWLYCLCALGSHFACFACLFFDVIAYVFVSLSHTICEGHLKFGAVWQVGVLGGGINPSQVPSSCHLTPDSKLWQVFLFHEGLARYISSCSMQ
jgi:hypothetical protein